MTLSAFQAAAREHLANPPATWTVHRVATGSWQVRTRDGAVVDRCATKAAAEQSRQDGPYVRLWQERTDWYLGPGTNPRDRPLTAEERAVVDQILHPTDTATGYAGAVRFCDRDDHDHQVWIATPTPEGRWAIQSLPWWTFTADELEFLDDDPEANAPMLDELFAACERWDRQLADDSTGSAAQDAAVTIIGILRRLAAMPTNR